MAAALAQLSLWARWWRYRLVREVLDRLVPWERREGQALVHETMRGRS